MPFKSAKQERFMWAKHPRIARKWVDKYGSYEHPKRDKEFRDGADKARK